MERRCGKRKEEREINFVLKSIDFLDARESNTISVSTPVCFAGKDIRIRPQKAQCRFASAYVRRSRPITLSDSRAVFFAIFQAAFQPRCNLSCRCVKRRGTVSEGTIIRFANMHGSDPRISDPAGVKPILRTACIVVKQFCFSD